MIVEGHSTTIKSGTGRQIIMEMKATLVLSESGPVDKTQEFLGLEAEVDPEGADANLVIHTSKGKIPLSVSFSRIAALHSEISHVDVLMLHRQAMRNSKGKAVVRELLHAALRPEKVSVFIDSVSGDRIFVQQFADRSPIVTRMTPDAVLTTLDELANKVKKASH